MSLHGGTPGSDTTAHLEGLAHIYSTPEGDGNLCSWGPSTSSALKRIMKPLGKNETVEFFLKKLLTLWPVPHFSTGTPESVKINLEIQVLSVSGL